MAANFGSKVSMTGIDKLASAIDQHDLKVKRAIAGVFLRSQDDAINFAKPNAPWTDRTGNARSGLFTKVNVIDKGASFEMIVAHSVSYGIWLEVRFSGKYAIIKPTIDYIGPILMDRIASAISRIEAA
jgi:hypothetical protein